MTTLLGILDFNDFAIIAVIVAVVAGGVAAGRRREFELERLDLQVGEIQKKLDALLKHHGVELPPPPPSCLSPEVERLAVLPSTKIAAIKLYRKQNPGASLVEAKKRIEEFAAKRG